MLRATIKAQVPFAIRSGGHATITGASNINGTGVTLDLSLLADIELSEDSQSVRLGTAARWSEVYEALEQQGLSIAGGRAGVVGVGGFLLGGGVSWFSNLYGWSCDSVVAFEVLLASGDIAQASKDQHEDLFWALKGGGGLHGLVISFRMRTIALKGIWGGSIAYTEGQESTLLSNIVDTAQAMSPKEQSSTFLSFGFTPASRYVSSSSYIVDLTANPRPPFLESFLSLPREASTLRTMNMSDSAAELSDSTTGENRYRQAKFSLTFHADAKLLQQIYLICSSTSQTWPAPSPSSLLAITFQPLSSSHLSHAGRATNALGFSPPAPINPLIMFSFEIRWHDAEDHRGHEKRARSLHDQLKRVARGEGKLHRFVYANYAAGWQDVFASYGGKALQRLKEVRDRYDEQGVFEVLRPGGLRLV